MRITDRLKTGAPCFSFEFFPPKTEDGVTHLFEALRELAELEPGFVSVTYGAGGSTRRGTLDITTRIKRETGIEPMAHLACIGHTRGEIAEVLDTMQGAGIENVLCLRGDPPRDQPQQYATTDGFRFASELTEYVRGGRWGFTLGGACYPEGHLENPSREDDLRVLKNKVEGGAQFLITQLFYDNAFYFDFVARARAAGITVPILPGIMPITTFEQIERIARMCGATIPMRMRLEVERRKDDPESIVQLGVAHATVQCVELLQRGAPGVHFYTLNRSRATRMILTALRTRSHLP
ncbi:MAG: methylenetetrahydrofolate reductase [NAD(P)H] [Myxococcales bacterium]|nr:methylenetetrahydrofolate reductase [NAD(P)H] [Myxococcales bacterium]